MDLKRNPDIHAQRGNDIFERKISDLVKDFPPRDFVVIDIDSEDFEVDPLSSKALQRLKDRRPGATIFFRRVGSSAAYRFGFRGRVAVESRIRDNS